MDVTSILLNKILSASIRQGASSIHLSIGSPPMIRVNNKLVPLESEKAINLDTMNSIMNSIVDEEDVNKLETDKDLILVKDFAGNFRFRINIFYEKKLPAVSFYLIPNEIKDFESLGLPDIIGKWAELNSGLLVITGPYGAGKTTTSASYIEHINKTKNKFIVTLEDPIEYLFTSKKSIVNQRQVGRDVNSVIDGLNYCLSEEVDLIYISKIKHAFEEAVPIILDLAAGNALVVLELNADTTVSAIEKIVNAASRSINEESVRYTLSDVLKGIVTQQLHPKIGGGLVPAFEVLVVNPAVKSLIRDGKYFQIDSVIQTSRQDGMIGMKKSVDELAQAGVIKQ